MQMKFLGSYSFWNGKISSEHYDNIVALFLNDGASKFMNDTVKLARSNLFEFHRNQIS